jgi:hypothetical protein
MLFGRSGRYFGCTDLVGHIMRKAAAQLWSGGFAV